MTATLSPNRSAQIQQLIDAGDNQGLYKLAKTMIPGGTQLLSKRPEMFAPDRWPAYYREAAGCQVTDLSGNKLIDMVTNGIGGCLLGFNHPEVTAAVIDRIQRGSFCTLNNPEEVQVAQKLIDWHPWAGAVRYARTGGESMAVAVRIARAHTRRDVVAFCGYHGWSDWYLAANLGEHGALDGHLLPGLSPTGVPRGLKATALPFAYNQIKQLEEIVAKHGKNLAAVIMEPTRNQEPQNQFLQQAKALAHECGAVFIFDEISAGFRLARGGAHLRYGVDPDIAVFAKALGNGHPIGAVLGREQVMASAQDSFISSTYWTEGVGFAAALATMKVMEENDVPAHVDNIGKLYANGLTKLAQKHKLPLKVAGHPCIAHYAFDHPQGAALMTLYTVRMLDHGYLTGASFYPTLAHQPGHVEKYLLAADEVYAELADAMAKGDAEKRLGSPVKQSGFARLS
ncbi:MAG: aminotransferase class III-fold pyridoxal phosphate-dependent enzyme [Phycisphaerales bacterium]|nr:aminotransferase class III-fold pyridoxal phosphate-dependent enzyme [Phycisphaerales bacterium]